MEKRELKKGEFSILFDGGPLNHGIIAWNPQSFLASSRILLEGFRVGVRRFRPGLVLAHFFVFFFLN
jgi:hypothetical protein